MLATSGRRDWGCEKFRRNAFGPSAIPTAPGTPRDPNAEKPRQDARENDAKSGRSRADAMRRAASRARAEDGRAAVRATARSIGERYRSSLKYGMPSAAGGCAFLLSNALVRTRTTTVMRYGSILTSSICLNAIPLM